MNRQKAVGTRLFMCVGLNLISFMGIVADKDGKTALQFLVAALFKLSDTSMVEFLIDAGADINAATKDGKTALHWATGRWACHRNIVKALVDAGADVNATTEDGSTALHLAAERGQESIVRALTAAGADVNAATKDGSTALHLAAEHCRSLTYWNNPVEALIGAGANVSATADDGKTALDLATRGFTVLVRHSKQDQLAF